jgi:hypothetical protein
MLCCTSAMPARHKLDLEKIGASLSTDCLHCGHSIAPAERTHIDIEHLECLRSSKRFMPGRERPLSTSCYETTAVGCSYAAFS